MGLEALCRGPVLHRRDPRASRRSFGRRRHRDPELPAGAGGRAGAAGQARARRIGKRGPLTVKDALEHYLGWLAENRRSAVDAAAEHRHTSFRPLAPSRSRR